MLCESELCVLEREGGISDRGNSEDTVFLFVCEDVYVIAVFSIVCEDVYESVCGSEGKLVSCALGKRETGYQ